MLEQERRCLNAWHRKSLVRELNDRFITRFDPVDGTAVGSVLLECRYGRRHLRRPSNRRARPHERTASARGWRRCGSMAPELPIACSMTATQLPARLADMAGLGRDALRSAHVDGS